MAGIGPVPMIAGSTPAVAQEAMRASGFRPRVLASSALISTRAAAPSLRPEALAAVTVPSLVKAGRRPDDALQGGAVADVFVLVDDGVALAALDGDRRDLVGELAGLLGGLGLVLRGDGEARPGPRG